MALPGPVNKLKNEGTKDDKVAVASGIAISVVVILFVAWAIIFLRNVARGSQNLDLGGGAQDAFNFSSVRDAQEALKKNMQDASESDLERARQESATPAVMQTVPMQTQGEEDANQFGSPFSEY